jgi:hypothetical protein
VGVAAVVALLLLGAGAFGAWKVIRDDPSGSGRAPGGDGTVTGQQSDPSAKAGAAQQSAKIGKTVWYAGLKLTFGTLSYDATKTRDHLSVEVLVENLADKDTHPDVDILFTLGDQQYSGNFREGTSVGSGTKSNLHVDFDVLKALTGSLTSGTFIVGRGEKARAVVPVGAGELVAYEPRVILKDTKVTHRDLVVTYTTCELRGGFLSFHGQADKDHRALTCSVAVQYTGGERAGHYFGEGNFRLGLPDGTEIGPTVAPNEALYSADIKPGTYLGFQVKMPVTGRYVLKLVDVHGGEKRAPSMVSETPLTL